MLHESAINANGPLINVGLAVRLGLLTLLSLLLMITSVALLLGVSRRQASAYTDRHRLETSALRLSLALEEESNSITTYLTHGNEQTLDRYRTAIQSHQAALLELRTLSQTAEEMRLVQEIYINYARFLLGAEQQIDQFRRGQATTSAARLAESQAQQDALRASINRLVSQRQQTIDADIGRTQGLQVLVYPLMALGVLIAFSVVGTALWLARPGPVLDRPVRAR